MPRVGPVNTPGGIYNQVEEQRFRRNLELFLQAVSDELIGTQELEDIISALSAKRTTLSTPSVGVGISGIGSGGSFESITLGADGITFTSASKIKVEDGESESLVFENSSDSARDYIKIGSVVSDDKVTVPVDFSVLGGNDIIKDIQTRYRGEAVIVPPGTGDGLYGSVTQDLVEFTYNFSGRSGVSTVLWMAFLCTNNLDVNRGGLDPDAPDDKIYWELDGSIIGDSSDQSESATGQIANGGRVVLFPSGSGGPQSDTANPDQALGIPIIAIRNNLTAAAHTVKLTNATTFYPEGGTPPFPVNIWGLTTSGTFAFSFDLGVT